MCNCSKTLASQRFATYYLKTNCEYYKGEYNGSN